MKQTLFAAMLWVAFSARAGEVVMGAPLPDTVTKVGENRFRSYESYVETMKSLNKIYDPSKFPHKAIINQPGVKAVHIANPSGKGYEGLNVYEANNEVRIYVIPAGDVKKKPSKSKSK